MGKVEEMMVRRSSEDVIEIGESLRKFYNGQAGTIVRAIMNGLIKDQITAPQDNVTSADRRLGRAEGIQLLQDQIEYAIAQMEQLTTPQEVIQDGE